MQCFWGNMGLSSVKNITWTGYMLRYFGKWKLNDSDFWEVSTAGFFCTSLLFSDGWRNLPNSRNSRSCLAFILETVLYQNDKDWLKQCTVRIAEVLPFVKCSSLWLTQLPSGTVVGDRSWRVARCVAMRTPAMSLKQRKEVRSPGAQAGGICSGLWRKQMICSIRLNFASSSVRGVQGDRVTRKANGCFS